MNQLYYVCCHTRYFKNGTPKEVVWIDTMRTTKKECQKAAMAEFDHGGTWAQFKKFVCLTCYTRVISVTF